MAGGGRFWFGGGTSDGRGIKDVRRLANELFGGAEYTSGHRPIKSCSFLGLPFLGSLKTYIRLQ